MRYLDAYFFCKWMRCNAACKARQSLCCLRVILITSSTSILLRIVLFSPVRVPTSHISIFRNLSQSSFQAHVWVQVPMWLDPLSYVLMFLRNLCENLRERRCREECEEG